MSNKKKVTIASIVVIVLAVISGIGYGIGHKTTAETLQSQNWTFDSQKGEKVKATAKFTEKKMVLNEAGFSDTYTYTVKDKGSQEEIKFINNNSVSGEKETRTFSIKKDSDEYKLTPTNKLAKDDTGSVTLIPDK